MKPGIYIHIPFCVQKCSYCDFYSIVDLSVLDQFVTALSCEMKLAQRAHGAMFSGADTVYFGGGTPSVLGAERIARLLRAAREVFAVSEDSEITVEINPGTISGTFLSDIKEAGVNRISIGVQSFDDEDLIFLGRIHSAEEARATVNEVKALYDNYSIDLIHSIPGQRIGPYRDSLDEAVRFGAPHISAYALTIEHNTPLFELCDKGKVPTVSEDDAVMFLEATMDSLGKSGYVHYEISNFARRETYISRHNSKYWELVPYIGLGPSGHSFDGTNRWSNLANVKEYCAKLAEKLLPLGGEELLNRDELFVEQLMLGLRRLDKGLDLNYLRSHYAEEWDDVRENRMKDFIRQGYMARKGDRIMLTSRGSLVYNMIVRELTA
ncbi:MAG: radical SAM family heme chaperone HemW [Candidatus Omnitrophica bacterium]|nr:radical SAM family heme chaperone HemW [Candidatus Omnitrophota bacterium]